MRDSKECENGVDSDFGFCGVGGDRVKKLQSKFGGVRFPAISATESSGSASVLTTHPSACAVAMGNSCSYNLKHLPEDNYLNTSNLKHTPSDKQEGGIISGSYCDMKNNSQILKMGMPTTLSQSESGSYDDISPIGLIDPSSLIFNNGHDQFLQDSIDMLEAHRKVRFAYRRL